MNVRCAMCPELVRSEDDFTRDELGRFVHVDCLEADPEYPFWLMGKSELPPNARP